MEGIFILSRTILFLFLTNGVIGQDRVLIDVKSDIPTGDSSWNFECTGYGDLSTDIDCGALGGKIDVPPEHLNGERGFWASCSICEITYHVKPNDVTLKARLYQRDVLTEVSFDGEAWEFVPGEGWVVFEEDISAKKEISFRFEHFTSSMFNLLEKIAINGDFDEVDPSPTTTESGSSPGITETTVPVCPTTAEPEPCNCCSSCSRNQPQEVHHHYHNHYYYHPAAVPEDAK